LFLKPLFSAQSIHVNRDALGLSQKAPLPRILDGFRRRKVCLSKACETFASATHGAVVRRQHVFDGENQQVVMALNLNVLAAEYQIARQNDGITRQLNLVWQDQGIGNFHSSHLP
jgi:hypothetical protein